MKVHWIIEKDVFEEGNPERLLEIVERKGMEAKVLGYVPFGGGVYETRKVHRLIVEEDSLFPKDACVVAYGSINLVRRLLAKAPWTPTAWMDLPALRCNSYYAHWGHWCLQQRYYMLPWGEVDRRGRRLYDELGADTLFFRPNENTKVFSGKLVAEEDFRRWFDQEEYCYSPGRHQLVVIAEPKKIEAEWRFVISEGKVITASRYKQDGVHSEETMEEGAPEGAMSLAEDLARDDWQPQPIYCADVCLSEGRYRLLEIGDVACAGLYRCDLEKYVDAVSSLALKAWKEQR